jgi:hypothetical protein
LLVACLLGTVLSESAAISFVVEEGTASLPVEVDFNTYSGPQPYINQVIEIKGGSISALFLGQESRIETDTTGAEEWNYDVLTVPDATGPELRLTFLAPTPGPEYQNLAIVDVGSGTHDLQIGGVANSPTSAGMGGSLSILFDVDQSQFGLSFFGYEDDDAVIWFDFLGRDGSHLGHVAYEPPNAERTNVLRAIATDGVFAGLTITNNDRFGLSYDDFRFVATPSPSVTALLFGGLCILILGRKWAASRAPRHD